MAEQPECDWFCGACGKGFLSCSCVGADVVCEHGTAADVHCCGCHSGFLFEDDHDCEEVIWDRELATPPPLGDQAEGK